ncbi:MAG: DNA polymerase III subunit alpha [Clostridia bacterium]|nr:DNA polymerase III subunit alpha [Clostridia bacterium]MDD4798108.1 DNA polymerase III subunit alpha [Clostridia bacterium]
MSFVHLHNHTEYSLLDGAARIATVKDKDTKEVVIKGLLDTAKDLGMNSLAITDHGVMFGVLNFYKTALKAGIKPILGCEVYVAPRSRFQKEGRADGAAYHLILLAKNEQGYKNLCHLVSLGFLEGYYYKPRIDFELLQQYHDGLICLSGCIAGELPALLLENRYEQAKELAARYRELFGEDYYLEIQNHGLTEEDLVMPQLARLSAELDIPLVATNDLHYIKKSDAKMHDVLLCIQTQSSYNDPERMRFTGQEFYLKTEEEMRALFPKWPQAIENTQIIADKCNVTLTLGEFYLPDFEVPENYTLHGYLVHLCREGLSKRYDDITDELVKRLDFELGIIEKMGFSGYFLIVWDMINFCHESDIRVGPGRGSAAGSLVAYCLGITNIDPIKYDLLFERFLNPERVNPPDIDTDFCNERRGEVIDYLVRKYGEEKVGQIATFGTMKAKGAVRDVGRVMDIPYGDVNRVAKLIPNDLDMTLPKALETSEELKNIYESDPLFHETLDLALQIEGMPRHASVHAAGVVIAKEAIINYMPVHKGKDDGIMSTQFEKGEVEESGLLKMDLLGLRTLDIIGHTLDNIHLSCGEEIDIETISLDDPAVYEMLSAGDAISVFQLESDGMRQLLRNMRPERFEDLIALMALYRPGPLGSGMVDDFCKAKHGEIEIKYKHPILEPILSETYGVILYQEQVMRIATDMAGFTLGQSDMLRRIMGKKKPELLPPERARFVEGCKRHNNIDEKLALEVFDLMEYFAGYGFNKSHSAAYARVTYQTAWLKAHYPTEFMAAMLTNEMDNLEKMSFYISECKQMDIIVLPPDINESEVDFAVFDRKIRYALGGLKGVGREVVKQLVAERHQNGFYSSIGDLCARCPLNKKILESLIKSGALDSFGAYRSQMLAVLDKALELGKRLQEEKNSMQMSLFDFGIEDASAAELTVNLPELPEFCSSVLLQMELETIGIFVSGHPLDIYEKYYKSRITCPLGDTLEKNTGDWLRLAGTITDISLRKTRNGNEMALFMLADKTATLRCVAFAKNYNAVVPFLLEGRTVIFEGKLKVDEGRAEFFPEKAAAPMKLYMRLPDSTDEKMIDNVRDCLNGYPGHGEAIYYFNDLQQYQAVRGMTGVAPELALLNKLRELLGETNVVVK